jgi:hypothetical protein
MDQPFTPAMAGSSRPLSRKYLSALALGLVVVSGGLCLAMPFWGDQALFAVYARELARGAVLYRDLFDLKPPGIFLFYAAGGVLFGFTAVGIHLFELLYLVAFSAFAIGALRPYFRTDWGAPLVPVFSVVVHYLRADTLDLTQVEVLIAFPLLMAWWLIDQAQPATREGLKRYAAAGLATAAVMILKHVYLLIILAFLVHALLRARWQGVAVADLRRCLVVFVSSCAVPLLIVFVYFAAYGQLGRIWWIYVEYAPSAQMFAPRPFNFLVFGARSFILGHAPLLILAVLGCVRVLRERNRRQRDLMVGMVLWGVVGAMAYVTFQSWGVWKWSLFTVPVGILAVIGVEVLVGMASRDNPLSRPASFVLTALVLLSLLVGAPVPQVQTQLLWFVVIGVCAVVTVELFAVRPRARRALLHVVSATIAASIGVAAITPVKKLRVLMRHDLALTAQSRAEFQYSWNRAYKAADEDLEILRKIELLPGPFYVFGDPVLLLRANRPQAVAVPGWGPELLDSRAWRELDSTLRVALPPYIIVDRFSEPFVRSRSPGLMEWIESSYKVAFVGASGTWYLRPTRD